LINATVIVVITCGFALPECCDILCPQVVKFNSPMAARAVGREGIPARVISMPSWELLDAQPADYHVAVPPTGLPRIVIEARTTLAWARYVGDRGSIMGLDRFGASAP
jgi:transketolase